MTSMLWTEQATATPDQKMAKATAALGSVPASCGDDDGSDGSGEEGDAPSSPFHTRGGEGAGSTPWASRSRGTDMAGGRSESTAAKGSP